MIFSIYLLTTQSSGLMSQKDFSTFPTSITVESPVEVLSLFLLTFSIVTSFSSSQISDVSSSETTPVMVSSVSGVKCSDTNLPIEISVPFETNSEKIRNSVDS